MRHGGDLCEATRLFGSMPGGWLDLSTGVNPRPYPVAGSATLGASLTRLPSPEALAALLNTARVAYGVPEGAAVAAAPGTEILIRALPGLFADSVTIVHTSYRSFSEALAQNVRQLTTCDWEGARAAAPQKSIIVVNPNNPDGRILDSSALLTLARTRAPNQLLVVDEAYADAEPEISVVPHLRGDDPVLVLKSFGKFFGLPGLRLGFAIGFPPFVEELAARLGDWPVSGPAIAIGNAALSDSAWRMETQHWLGNQAQALDGALKNTGLRLGGGCRLFRTAYADDAAAVHAALARQGIWTRIFADRPDLLRLGLPPDLAGLEQLAAALAVL